MLHHQTRRQNRVTQMADTRHRTGFQAIAVHHAGVQFVGFVASKYRPNARVKQRALFQQTYRLGDDIKRALARLQHPLARFNNGRKRVNVAFFLLRTQLRTGNCPCAAVNCDHRINHFHHPSAQRRRFFYKYHYRCQIFRRILNIERRKGDVKTTPSVSYS
ncbi:hypothetical protein D3C72_1044920 [compost metagenome]